MLRVCCVFLRYRGFGSQEKEVSCRSLRFAFLAVQADVALLVCGLVLPRAPVVFFWCPGTRLQCFYAPASVCFVCDLSQFPNADGCDHDCVLFRNPLAALVLSFSAEKRRR